MRTRGLLAAGLWIVSACRTPPGPRMRIHAPGPSWDRVEGVGDLAWYEPRQRATMAVNGTCREPRDAPLTVLASDLLLGTTDRRTLLDETVALAGREARHRVTVAKLDGVPLVFDLYVLKKDGCVYDLALVAPPGAYEALADEYVERVGSFRAEGR